MRTTLTVLLALAAAILPDAASAASRHHRHVRRVARAAPPAPIDYAPVPAAAVVSPLAALPLVGPVTGALSAGIIPLDPNAGRPIPTDAARFMGYPYDVPGYRYTGYDACLLRVGGVFGPGPSAGPCPFGLDRAF